MVRFTYSRSFESSINGHSYFPFYTEQWTSYDPKDTSKCTNKSWNDVWQKDYTRDKLHRKNSYYYRREIRDGEVFQNSSALAILLFGSIIFCLFVPQIIDLLATIFFPGHRPPPSPPTPPPGPKSQKCLRLYHYASPNTKRRRKRLSDATTANDYNYDPENMFNYLSATRIKILEEFNDDADDEAELSEAENNPTKRTTSQSLKIPFS